LITNVINAVYTNFNAVADSMINGNAQISTAKILINNYTFLAIKAGTNIKLGIFASAGNADLVALSCRSTVDQALPIG
jgi:hypothetical protein